MASNEAATPVFSEDFNQPVGSLPNDKTWYQNRDNQKDPNNNNITYANTKDTLQVVADSGAKDGKALALTINKVGEDKHGNPLFESARITTQIDPVAGKLQYGRVEARIRLSSAKGSDPVWPAFWMLGSDIPRVGWPKCGEIDILEYNGNARTTTGTLVTPDPQYRYHNQYNGASLSDGQYHTFAIEWSRGSVTFEVDGNAYATIKRGNNKQEIPANEWNFDKPFYVILNVAAFPGQKADFTSQTMYVDYVRAYSSSTLTPRSK
jgi:beta-glucanase (GH16 family)